jgi:hypothetical protein
LFQYIGLLSKSGFYLQIPSLYWNQNAKKEVILTLGAATGQRRAPNAAQSRGISQMFEFGAV